MPEPAEGPDRSTNGAEPGIRGGNSPGPGLVELLAADPGIVSRVLTAHAADRAGRCPLCSAGADGSPRAVHPCRLYSLARAARGEGGRQ